MEQFPIENKKISEIKNALNKILLQPFVLVAISGLNWNSDMCPWKCSSISKYGTPCAGGADAILNF